MKPISLILLLLAPFTSLKGQTITIEAESFTKQTLTETRKWEIKSDLPGASGGKYIQVLPDTRKTHADKLIHGENFSEEPGKMALLEFPFEAKEAGRYFVWARTFSSNAEDNGLHFGLNETWPESGKRWQTVQTGDWHWDCKQRTAEVHTGVPRAILRSFLKNNLYFFELL